jgi:feruloyl-CoA synthase
VRGPNVTPGYWKRPDLTKEAFDDEGYYKPGDAVQLADPADPRKGVIFDGRLAEDFKLLTGTWVHVGSLRIGMLAAASPILQDVLIAGENRGFVALLAWLSAPGCSRLLGSDASSVVAELAHHPAVREHVRKSIVAWNERQTGASRRIERVIILPDAPSIDANEITDKGYVNQRLALARRQADVERLFALSPDRDVIIVEGEDLA